MGIEFSIKYSDLYMKRFGDVFSSPAALVAFGHAALPVRHVDTSKIRP